MWSQQLLSAATRRSLLGSPAKPSKTSFVLRNRKPGGRYLSSVVPDYNHGHDEHSTQNFSKNQQALEMQLTASPTVASKQVPKNQGSQRKELGVTPTNDGAAQVENDIFQSPSELIYSGHATMPVTSDLHIVTPQDDTPRGVWPVFRIMVSQRWIVRRRFVSSSVSH